jgi:hypothetical protein
VAVDGRGVEHPRGAPAGGRVDLGLAGAQRDLLLGLRINDLPERDERVGAPGPERDQRVIEQREEAVLVAAAERLVDLGDQIGGAVLGLLRVDRRTDGALGLAAAAAAAGREQAGDGPERGARGAR